MILITVNQNVVDERWNAWYYVSIVFCHLLRIIGIDWKLIHETSMDTFIRTDDRHENSCENLWRGFFVQRYSLSRRKSKNAWDEFKCIFYIFMFISLQSNKNHNILICNFHGNFKTTLWRHHGRDLLFWSDVSMDVSFWSVCTQRVLQNVAQCRRKSRVFIKKRRQRTKKILIRVSIFSLIGSSWPTKPRAKTPPSWKIFHVNFIHERKLRSMLGSLHFSHSLSLLHVYEHTRAHFVDRAQNFYGCGIFNTFFSRCACASIWLSSMNKPR